MPPFISFLFLFATCTSEEPRAYIHIEQIDEDRTDIGDAYLAPYPSLFFPSDAPPLPTSAEGMSIGNNFVKKISELAANDEAGNQTRGVHFLATAPLLPIQERDILILSAKEAPRVETHTTTTRLPFAPAHLVTVMPKPGEIFAEGLHHIVLLDSIHHQSGRRIKRGPGFQKLFAGDLSGVVANQRPFIRNALDDLLQYDAPWHRVVAWAPIQVQDSSQSLRAATKRLRDELSRPTLRDMQVVYENDNYCALEGLVRMPSFQQGQAPYLETGGNVDFESAPTWVDSRIILTLPNVESNAPLPAVNFVRQGAGGMRPLIDRGIAGTANEQRLTSFAADFAKEGYAALSIDGPLGGMRNATGADEQFLFFNFFNGQAIVGNVKQAAMELSLQMLWASDWSIDPSNCSGWSRATRLEPSVLFGHSIGASVAATSASLIPELRRLILSGAGASYINNILYKEQPFEVLPVANDLVGYENVTLSAADPLLHALQSGLEEADPPSYLAHLSSSIDVLMFQGIEDHFIPPPISNALAVALNVELVGPELDGEFTESFRDRRQQKGLFRFPLQGNHFGSTRALVQLTWDGVEDDHEVVFLDERARSLVRCFLNHPDQTPAVVANDC